MWGEGRGCAEGEDEWAGGGEEDLGVFHWKRERWSGERTRAFRRWCIGIPIGIGIGTDRESSESRNTFELILGLEWGSELCGRVECCGGGRGGRWKRAVGIWSTEESGRLLALETLVFVVLQSLVIGQLETLHGLV